MDLSKYSLFEGLAAAELSLLLPLFKEKALQKGSYLFREGDVGCGMFVIIEGTCRMQRTMPDGHSQIIATLKKGELFGEMSIVSKERRSCDCFVPEEGRLWLLSSEDFAVLEEQQPALWTQVLENIGTLLCGRLTAMTDEVCSLMADLADVADDLTVFEHRLTKGKEGILNALWPFRHHSTGVVGLRGGPVKGVQS